MLSGCEDSSAISSCGIYIMLDEISENMQRLCLKGHDLYNKHADTCAWEEDKPRKSQCISGNNEKCILCCEWMSCRFDNHCTHGTPRIMTFIWRLRHSNWKSCQGKPFQRQNKKSWIKSYFTISLRLNSLKYTNVISLETNHIQLLQHAAKMSHLSLPRSVPNSDTCAICKELIQEAWHTTCLMYK